MYSIIESGGFQYKVTLGETLKVPKIQAEVGAEITVSQVLLFADGDNISVGTPVLDNTSVIVEVLSHGKSDKIKVFKKKRRKGFRRTAGHRQDYTELLIKSFINGSNSHSVDIKIANRVRARVKALQK
jgi:large subunit ribosomal protein L21